MCVCVVHAQCPPKLFSTILSFIFISSLADIGGTLLVETELIPVFESMLQVCKTYLFSILTFRESFIVYYISQNTYKYV